MASGGKARKWLIVLVCVLSALLVLGVALAVMLHLDEQQEPAQTDPSTTETIYTQPETTVEETTEETTVGVEITEILMTFVGDCTFGKNQNHSYKNSFLQKYDQEGPDYFFANVRKYFEQDDVTVLNLEGSLTNSTDRQIGKQFCHKGPPEYVQIMTGSSVEVATMGNNHRVDYGQKGFEETISVLQEAGIGYCYENQVYLVHEVKGVKIGFVACNEYYKGKTVEKWFQQGYEYLKEQGCQIFIAAPHWGGDKTPVIEDYQKELGKKIIDMGYDLVVGTHPHVLQGMEIYNDRLICYSLGNFCYGGNKNPEDRDSGILQYKFTFVDGELQVGVDARLIPVHWCDPLLPKNNYQPNPVEGEEYTRIIEKINGYSVEFNTKLDETGRPVLIEE